MGILLEQLTFQLLDASYEVIGPEARVLLWGRTKTGERVLLFHRGFRPYFYIIPREGFSLGSEEIEQVKLLSKPKSPIIDVSVVDRKFFGRPVKALKVTTMIPEYVRVYREAAAKLGFVERVLEADIRYTMRYLIDNNVYPLRWYRATVNRVEKGGYRVDGTYEIVGSLEEVEEEEISDPLSDLRIMAFDIEVYSKEGSPDPLRDNVIIIAISTQEGSKAIRLDVEGSEQNLIKAFTREILKEDPDIIVGYNQDRFDWPFLKERSSKLGVKLDVGRRIGAQPETSVYGHVSIAGRLNVDLYNFAEEIPGLTLKTLEEVAEFLGVKKKSERVIIPWYRIPEYWDDPRKRETLIRYALDDVESTYGLSGKFLPFGAQLSTTTGIPLDHVMAASTGFRLEWRLIREAYKRGELVPERVERPPASYTGALVLKPEPGIKENVAVLDFASMYPSIMVKYNVGPDTLVRGNEEVSDDEVNVAPMVGHRFRKTPDGFFKGVLLRFLKWRRDIKSRLKRLKPGSPEYLLLDQRQRAIKVLANAMYGYMGWSGARWYCKECAEAVTAWGRELILTAINHARKLGLKVYYGDTDSLFVDYDKEKVEALIKYVEEEMGFEIKIDKIYKRIIFTGAKKRYAGLTVDGIIDVTGLEAVRGDWCELAKEVQLEVLRIVLIKGSTREAVDYVRRVINDLRSGRIPLEKLVIWKTLTRRPSEYKVDGAHVKAALILEKMGYKVAPGMKIGYVIVKGHGKLSDRAKPFILASPDEVDIDYYVEKQIIPAALRVLQVLGVSENELKMRSRGQRSLFDFM
ncbi:MAG: DNA polymerase II [Desulfurococcales archaeon]|nr:DNA polymerase II [Desulfurococcales archaeon]